MTDWLTPAQVAEHTNRHADTVRRALENGELHGHQRLRKGRWQVNATAMDAWVMGVDGAAACDCARYILKRKT